MSHLDTLDTILEDNESIAITSPSYQYDPRITRLSYSSRNTLHACPRKYQLAKLAKPEYAPRTDNVTFAFGHAVGEGIQAALENNSWNQTVIRMLLAWDLPDLYAEEEKTNKSFLYAMFAVKHFISIRESLLEGYELAYFEGKPAVELSFRIDIANGFTYRGYVDVVLYNRITGKYIVLEIKTTGSKYVSEATYKNSSQATGYSVVLDTIVPNIAEYDVWYLVYMTTQQQFEILKFTKYLAARANWIQELLLDVNRLEEYERVGYYPRYGESCNDFMRPCEFYTTCNMSDRYLLLAYDPETMPDKDYLINLNLLELIDTQLERQV